jgi:hypothetical protein
VVSSIGWESRATDIGESLTDIQYLGDASRLVLVGTRGLVATSP